MKINYSQLYTVITSIAGLMNERLPIGLSLKTSKLLKQLRDKETEVEPVRKKLWDESSDAKNGDYSPEFLEFLTTDFEFEFEKIIITKDDFLKCEQNGVSISPATILNISDFIDFE